MCIYNIYTHIYIYIYIYIYIIYNILNLRCAENRAVQAGNIKLFAAVNWRQIW